MSKNGNGRYSAQVFIDAIKGGQPHPDPVQAKAGVKVPGSAGIISTIATRVGCAWITAKKYIDNYPTIAQAYADECERVLDMAESQVLKSISAGDTSDAKWYLTKKGKHRGYVDSRQEVKVDADVKTDQLSQEEINERIRAIVAEVISD